MGLFGATINKYDIDLTPWPFFLKGCAAQGGMWEERNRSTCSEGPQNAPLKLYICFKLKTFFCIGYQLLIFAVRRVLPPIFWTYCHISRYYLSFEHDNYCHNGCSLLGNFAMLRQNVPKVTNKVVQSYLRLLISHLLKEFVKFRVWVLKNSFFALANLMDNIVNCIDLIVDQYWNIVPQHFRVPIKQTLDFTVICY